MTSRSIRRVDNLPTIIKRVSSRHLSTRVLPFFQSSKNLWNVPLPWRSYVNKVQILTCRKSFKITLTIGINGWSLLSGLLHHLRRPETFVIDNVTDGIHLYFFDRQKLIQNTCATQAHAHDSQADDITWFKPDSDHRCVFCDFPLRLLRSVGS